MHGFVKKQERGNIILSVYMLTGNDQTGILQLKRYLSSLKNRRHGTIKYFLGIEVSISSRGICLSSWKYSLDLLHSTNNLGANPATTLVEAGHKLFLKERIWTHLAIQISYAACVGSPNDQRVHKWDIILMVVDIKLLGNLKWRLFCPRECHQRTDKYTFYGKRKSASRHAHQRIVEKLDGYYLRQACDDWCLCYIATQPEGEC